MFLLCSIMLGRAWFWNFVLVNSQCKLLGHRFAFWQVVFITFYLEILTYSIPNWISCSFVNVNLQMRLHTMNMGKVICNIQIHKITYRKQSRITILFACMQHRYLKRISTIYTYLTQHDTYDWIMVTQCSVVTLLV